MEEQSFTINGGTRAISQHSQFTVMLKLQNLAIYTSGYIEFMGKRHQVVPAITLLCFIYIYGLLWSDGEIWVINFSFGVISNRKMGATKASQVNIY